MSGVASILEADTAKKVLPTNLTSSQIARLPKLGKKSDKLDKLRPIEVILKNWLNIGNRQSLAA